jgi:hypothetical protein
MTLAGCLHCRKLRLIELRAIDISPIKCRPVHRETGRHCAIGTNNYVVLARTPSPFQPYFFRSSPKDMRTKALISCNHCTEFTI